MTGAAYPNWDAIYRDNVTWVYRLMYGKVGNQPDAEDLTAEVFMTALRPLRVSATVPEVRKYLRMTARTVLASYWGDRMGRRGDSHRGGHAEADEPENVASDAPDKVRRCWPACRTTTAGSWNCVSCRPFRCAKPPARWASASRTPRCCSTARCGWRRRRARRTHRERTRLYAVSSTACCAAASTEQARPDDFEAEQMKTAIELRAARLGSDAPREEFVTDLHRRLAAAVRGRTRRRPSSGRRRGPAAQVVDRRIGRGRIRGGRVGGRAQPAGPDGEPATDSRPQAQGELDPNAGTGDAVGASADLAERRRAGVRPGLGQRIRASHRRPPRGGLRRLHPSGLQALAGCARERLRCPCHSTSFSLEGTNVTHQLPIAPPPLPKFQVRETDGVIEVFAPGEPL